MYYLKKVFVLWIQAVRIGDEATLDSCNSSDLDLPDTYGYTPLHYAAKYRRYDLLMKLLEKGASKL